MSKALKYHIQEAHWYHNYRLLIWFDDKCKCIDLKDYITKSDNPLINQYTDIEKFKQFKIDENGVLVWGDGDFDLNPESIYNGVFDVSQQ